MTPETCFPAEDTLEFLLKIFPFSSMCMFVRLCLGEFYTHRGASGGQRAADPPLELKQQMVVGHLMSVLGTELGSLGRTGSSLTTEPSLLNLLSLSLFLFNILFINHLCNYFCLFVYISKVECAQA